MLNAPRSQVSAAVFGRLASALERHQFESDPVRFITDNLGEFLWSKQREIVEAVREHRRVAVKSCHDVGKSWLAARIAAWWLASRETGDAFVITSAPTFPQVRNILWREIGRAHRKGNLPGRVTQTEWFMDEQLVAFGRKPADTDVAGFQGIHARQVLVIFDEACGIPRALWDAADTLVTNDESKFFAIGNPDDPLSEFAEVCKPGSGWHVVHIDALASPNFTDEPVPDKLRQLLVGKTWVEERKRKWGEGSPLYQAKVRGEFPDQATDGLVPYSALRAAVLRELQPGEPVELGVDVARQGNDHTVIYVRRGSVARRHAKLHERDLMAVVGHVVRAIRSTGATRVKIDAAGMGWGPYDRLVELKNSGEFKAEIVAVNVGEGPRTPKAEERFANLRAELNWAMRERIVVGDIDLADDDDLLSQASAITYKLNSKAEIQLERKEDLKKRGLPSPDDWDALVLAFSDPKPFPGQGLFEYYKALYEARSIDAETGMVRLLVPDGISHVHTFSGRRVTVGEDRIIEVSPEDAVPLEAQGWKRVEAAV